MTTPSNCVLMSVYYRESADNLNAALLSLAQQSRPVDELVLVKDGQLSEELDALISRWILDKMLPIRLIELERNSGLTVALNTALRSIDSTLVCRMDSDDIAHPERLERQLAYMTDHPDVDVLGTAMFEFDTSPSNPIAFKPTSVTHEEISRKIIWRNPVNHPTVCFRTDAVRSVGGYPECRFVEDYYLWSKMMVAGARFHNLPDALHYQRFDRATIARRGGWETFKNELEVRSYLYQEGMAGWGQTLAAMTLQLVLRLSPLSIRQWIWQLSRKSANNLEH